MTGVQPAGTGAEPADGALLANVRPARTTQRGSARGLAGAGAAKPATVAQAARPFEAQLLVAAQDLPDTGNPQDERRPSVKDTDDDPADAGPPEAPLLAAAVVIEQRLQLVPADGAPAGPAGERLGVRAETARRSSFAHEAGPQLHKPAGVDSAATNPSATLPAGFEPIQPAPMPGTADVRPKPSGPVPPGTGLEMPITARTDVADRPPSAWPLAGRSAEQPARRDGAATLSPIPGFRLEPAGRPEAAVANVRAETVQEQGATPLPADILVSGAGEAAGLDVTIAAATPDLRDRFRAATDELLADLSAIGTEVDAIRVELRGELGDGGSGAGAGEDGGARGDIEQVPTGWRELDAAAGIDMAEAREPEPAAEPDGQSPQDSASDTAGGSRDRQQGHGAGFDLDRLRLVPQAQPARSAAVSGAAPGTPITRIDRYA